jgi:hypothetical protein
LQEWKALADFLLKDYSTAQSSDSDADTNGLEQYYQLSDDEEYVLIEALVAVVTLYMGTSGERKSKSKKKVHFYYYYLLVMYGFAKCSSFCYR